MIFFFKNSSFSSCTPTQYTWLPFLCEDQFLVCQATLSVQTTNPDVLLNLAENTMYRPIERLPASVFRLHRMHEMQTIVTDVCFVCLSITQLNSAMSVECAGSYSAAFAKSIWPLIISSYHNKVIHKTTPWSKNVYIFYFAVVSPNTDRFRYNLAHNAPRLSAIQQLLFFSHLT